MNLQIKMAAYRLGFMSSLWMTEGFQGLNIFILRLLAGVAVRASYISSASLFFMQFILPDQESSVSVILRGFRWS